MQAQASSGLRVSFSSATPGLVPLKGTLRVSSKASCASEIGSSKVRIPSPSASAPASSSDSGELWREGIRTPVTFLAPMASTATAAVSAESMPPESPITAFW